MSNASGATKIILVLFSIGLAVLLLPELLPVYDINDSSLHLNSAKQMADRILSFENPFDFFVPNWACGYPLFGHYQMLPHFILALLYLLTFKLISISVLYHVMVVVLLVAFPWSMYTALRRAGLEDGEALFAAIFSLAPCSAIGFGQEFASYTAYGSGLFTQLLGMVIFPWALQSAYEFISGTTSRWSRPIILMALLILSHIFLAYFAFLLLGFWWLLGFTKRRIPSMYRLALMGILAAVMVSFFIIPLVVNSDYHAFSRYEPLAKSNSYGIAWVLSKLFTGKLLDNGGLPILTFLAGLGFFVGLKERPSLSVGFLLSILFFAGRTTWGRLADLLPMSKDLHYERFIFGVHFFAVVLAGIALAWIFSKIVRIRHAAIKGTLLLLLVLIVVVNFRPAFKALQWNDSLLEYLHHGYEVDSPSIDQYFTFVNGNAPGRIYAGMRSGWGKGFKMAGSPTYLVSTYNGLSEIGHLAFGWSLAGDFTTLMEENRREHLALFNVTHILSPKDDNYWGVPPIFENKKGAVYRTSASGYIDLVETPFLLIADKYTYWNPIARWFKSPLVGQKRFVKLCFEDCDPKGYKQVITMTDPWHYKLMVPSPHNPKDSIHGVFEKYSPYGLRSPEPADPGKILGQSAGKKYSAKVQADQPATAMLKMSFHPFWRAMVNGKKVNPYPVSPGFVGVSVPQGISEVSFYYKAPWWKAALMLFLILIPIVTYHHDRNLYDPPIKDYEPQFRLGLRAIIILFFAAIMFMVLAAIWPTEKTPLEKINPVGITLEPKKTSEPVGYIYLDGLPFKPGLTATIKKGDNWERTYRLDKKHSSFEAWAGLPFNTLNKIGASKVIFEVWTDNQPVYKSAPVTVGRRPRYIQVDLTGKKLLKLVVRNFSKEKETFISWAQATIK